MPSAARIRWAKFRVSVVSVVAVLILATLLFEMFGAVLLSPKTVIYLYIPDASGLSSESPVRVDGIDVGRKIFEALRWAHIEEGEAIDRVSLKRAFGDQARRQFAPDHPRSAGDKDVHSIKLNGCYSAMPPSTRCAWPVM